MQYEIIKTNGKHEFVTKSGKSRFTVDELIKMLGGWGTLRWAYSETHEDSEGIKIETNYWMCSYDSAASENGNKQRPPLNREAMAAFHIEVPIYGDAIVAQSCCF